MRSTLLRRLALDVIAWFSGPTLFLFAYVALYNVSGRAVVPHLHLAFLV
jgi:hypothetical protein